MCPKPCNRLWTAHQDSDSEYAPLPRSRHGRAWYVFLRAIVCALNSGTDCRTPGHPTSEPAGGVDLTLCSKLERLHVELKPEFATDGQSPGILKAMLGSWRPDVPLRVVSSAGRLKEPPEIPRQEFADLLVSISHILEPWLRDQAASCSNMGGSLGESSASRGVQVCMWDQDCWRDWWEKHIRDCFPTSLTLGTLYIAWNKGE